MCNCEVPEGHTLCKEHWIEKMEKKKKLRSIDYVKKINETKFKQKFEGKYYFNSQKVKSKSELIICYFLTANGVTFQYEPLMTLSKEIRPDFVLDDLKGNTIILEHFGMDGDSYNKKRRKKEEDYKKLCSQNPNFYFISTNEEDITNLKDNLGKQLNGTPLKKPLWK